uniref:EGF-like domain-containing protein n=1 Tax=Alexandrium monilatum TaxID=311494 RepID=A0A7S4SGH6_9DINO
MGGPPSANVIYVHPARPAAMHLAAALVALVPALATGSVLRPEQMQQMLHERQATDHESSALLQQSDTGLPTESESMNYLLRTLSKFKKFAVGSSADLKANQRKQEQQLQDAIRRTSDPNVRLALEQSVASSEQSLLETGRVYESMVNFSDSMIGLIRSATSNGVGCDQMACGPHSSCTETTTGAECVCNEGYVGQGTNCRAPPEFMPHRLLREGTAGATEAADMDVNVFDSNRIAIVFRDVSAGNVGRVLVGRVREAGMADLSPPEQFTLKGGKAFNPVVAGTSSGKIAIAWRDDDRQGACWLRGASLGGTVRGADMAITWGQPDNFCSGQAHKMSIVGLPNGRVAVLFSDRILATQRNPMESFGNSLLAEVGTSGAVTVMGTYRFTDSPVCRLEVTKVTPSAFVLAARAGKAMDDMDPSLITRQEAMAMYGEVVGDDLVFDPNAMNIEPQRVHIWARGLSLIAPNTVAYAYQDGSDMSMKMAVIEIDPVTHRMTLAQQPVLLRGGFSPYVSMLSVPYTASDPHTLVYYEGNYSSMVSLCSWGVRDKKVSRCEDFSWLMQKLSSVSGVHLGGGKSFMVFSTEAGVPYYGVFGLSKK